MLYVKDMFQIVVSLHCFWTLQVLWLIVKADTEEENNCSKISQGILRVEAYIQFVCDQNSIRLKTMYGTEYKPLRWFLEFFSILQVWTLKDNIYAAVIFS